MSQAGGSVLHPEKFKRSSSDIAKDEGPAAGLASYDIVENTDANQLRDINQKLFSRLSEIRERNVELRKFEELSWEKDLEIVKLRSIETDLRLKLSGVRNDAEYSEQRRDEHIQEIARLRLTIERHDEALKHEKDEYNRKLAKILDQSWEKDFEIKRLNEQADALSQTLDDTRLVRAERERELAASHQHVVKLTKALAENSAEIDRLEERQQAQSAQFSDKFSEACGRREDEIERLMSVQAELKAAISRNEDERIKQQDEITRQTRSAWELQSKIDSLKTEVSEIQETNQLELKRAGDEYAQSLKRIADDHSQALARLKDDRARELAQLIENNAAKLQQVQIENERKIASMREKHENESEGLREVERVLNERFVRLQIEAGGQTKQIETLHQSIQDLRLSLQSEQNAHQNAKEDLKARAADLGRREDELKTLRTQEAMLTAELASEKEARRRSDIRIEEAQSRSQDLERQASQLRDRLSVREESHRNDQRAINALERKIEGFSASTENWQQTQAKLIHDLNQERVKRQEDAVTWQRSANEDHQKITVLQNSLKTLKEATDQYAATSKEQIEAIRERAETELNTVRERAQFDSKNVRERHETEVTAAREKYESKLAELTTLNAEFNERIHIQQQTQRENDSILLEEISNCRYEIKKSKEELRLAEEAHALALAKQKTESQSAFLAATQDLEAKLDTAEAEQATLRRLLGSRAATHEADEKQIEKREGEMTTREQQIAAREHQLRHYAVAVTEQKAELVRQTKLLADEIQMAAKMHPLKDYLKVTEFELSKVDVQLKLTPTLSVDRARLEACVKQMSEQRDFLKNVVEASTKRLEEQAASIMALVKSPKLIATPPLPPKIWSKEPTKTSQEVQVATSSAALAAPTKGSSDLTSN